MSGADFAPVIEVLTVSGFFTAVTETVKWALGRSRNKVDEAKVVQGMSLELLKPLRAELRETHASAAALRSQMHDLEVEMEGVIGWAIIARSILDANGLKYPKVPASILGRDERQ